MESTEIIAEAVKRIHRRDPLAMKLVYNAFAKEMLSLAKRITQNLNDAEDVIQESFLSSFQKIEQLKDPYRYKFWLKRIVANNSIKLIKNRVHFKPVEDNFLSRDTDESPWYLQIKFEVIQKEISALPDGCQQIFTLYLLDGFKHREIAELFNISESTSKSQYRYALKILRERLKANCHD